MRVCTVEQMRECDRRAMQQYGISQSVLMENAGLAAFSLLVRQFGPAEGKRYSVVCGLGNNGGDGLVVARKLFSAGAEVTICYLADPAKYTGAAKNNHDAAEALGIPRVRVTDNRPLELAELDGCACVVDAIFGTGISRAVEGRFRDAIEAINQCSAPVLSLDIPSGIHGDSGQSMGIHVQAHSTVTFGALKAGMLRYPAFDACGTIEVSRISFPPSLYNDASLMIRIPDIIELPERDAAAHKSSMGRTLCIAGAAAYYGAPILSASAVLKAGGGYSILASTPRVTDVAAARAPELVFFVQQQTPEGAVASHNEESLVQACRRMETVVLGPGLSLDAQPQALVRAIVPRIEVPLILDGDGLTAIAESPELIATRSAPTILTPHAGEMARITGESVDTILRDPYALLRKWAHKLHAVIVLKGPHSLIADPGGEITVNLSGNAGMATAGAGDVLSGTVAAMIGMGMTAVDAACAAVYIHGAAGDIAAGRKGEDGITAGDILESLPDAMAGLRRRKKAVWEDYGIHTGL